MSVGRLVGRLVGLSVGRSPVFFLTAKNAKMNKKLKGEGRGGEGGKRERRGEEGGGGEEGRGGERERERRGGGNERGRIDWLSTSLVSELMER